MGAPQRGSVGGIQLAAALVAAVALSASGAEQGPELADLLGRASAYVDAYPRQVSALVCEETYVQRVNDAALEKNGFPTPLRTLRASFMLVSGSDDRFTPFRDVFEVDGVAVHDRHERLAALFAVPSTDGRAQAEALTRASARHSLSEVERTINTPMFALAFLRAANVGRSAWQDSGAALIDGQPVRLLDFRETARPALVTRDGRRDLLSSGRFWIEPASGVVRRVRHTVFDGRHNAQVSVDFVEAATLHLWVPSRMDEVYREAPSRRIVLGTATYAHYERVNVVTDTSAPRPAKKPPV
jgi:hypothetical protein